METLERTHSVAEDFDAYLRHYNDTTTWLAETLDGSMRTPFEYTFNGRELYADDGSALGPIFDAAIEDARQIKLGDPRMGFELRRRLIERQEYNSMLAMMRGEAPNTMVVVSDFPPELMNASKDVGGYNVTRKQAMLRVITRQNGRLQMYSQSLDGSDREALEAIYEAVGPEPVTGELLGQRRHLELSAEEQQTLTDRLTRAHDNNLEQRFGGHWHAGRRETAHDTYTFACEQRDIVDHIVLKKMQGLATDNDMYNVAALLAKRFEAVRHFEAAIHVEPYQVVLGAMHQHLEDQLSLAGSQARAAGQVFSGCGVSAGASAEAQLVEAGYGNLDSDEDGELTFQCTNGHTNRRPRNSLGKKGRITDCWFPNCKDSVAC